MSWAISLIAFLTDHIFQTDPKYPSKKDLCILEKYLSSNLKFFLKHLLNQS